MRAIVDKSDLLNELRERIREREGRDPIGEGEVRPTGIGALDAALPGGGLPSGGLVEWVPACEGSGAWTLAVLAGAGVCRSGGGRLVLVEPAGGRLYGPAVSGLTEGSQPRAAGPQVPVCVRPGSAMRAAWALDQCLRCSAVGAAVCEMGRWEDVTLRRLGNAARMGGSVGLLVRSVGARRGAGPAAAVRLRVEPQPAASGVRRLRVDIERARGASVQRTLRLEVDLAAGVVHALAELCGSTGTQGRADR